MASENTKSHSPNTNIISLLPLISTLFVMAVFISCGGQIQTFYFIHNQVANSEANATSSKQLCNDFKNYVPDTNYLNATPVKYVRLNFHIISDNNGENNFSEINGRHYVTQLVEQANYHLRNNAKMRLPVGNNTPVLPVRIQYIISGNPEAAGDDGIYFHNDTQLMFANKKGSNMNDSYYSSALYEKYGILKGEVLNFFMIEHHPDSVNSPAYRATGDGICAGSWGKMINCYRESRELIDNAQNKGEIKFDVSGKARLFNHEVGHCLSLAHTWNSNDGCDDTPMHPNCWDSNSGRGCDSLWSNNMMDYNNQQSSVTPCQIAKMQHTVSNRPAVKKMILNTWCSPEKFSDIIIARNDHIEWKCNKEIEGNITVSNKASLTIYCRVSMPEKSKIIVKPGGRLILNGGTLTNDCNRKWQGIEIWKSEKSEGKVEMLNGAKIEWNEN
jgi:hypothetical protein